MPLDKAPILSYPSKKIRPLVVQSAVDVFGLEDGALLSQLDTTDLTDEQKSYCFYAAGSSFAHRSIIAWGYVDYPIDSYFYPIVRPNPKFSGLVVVPQFETRWALDFENTMVLWSNKKKLYASEFNQDAVGLYDGFINDPREVWNTGEILAQLFKPNLTLV